MSTFCLHIGRARVASAQSLFQFGPKQHSIVQRLLKALRRKAAEWLIAATTTGAAEARKSDAGGGKNVVCPAITGNAQAAQRIASIWSGRRGLQRPCSPRGFG
jgi:hypothetical protein